MNYLLPSLILVPLAASVAILLLGNNRDKAMVPVGVVASIITLLLSIALVFEVHNAPSAAGSGTIAPKVLFEPHALSIALPISVAKQPIQWQLILGADGISALLVLLTGIIGCFTIVLATKQIETRTAQYIALMLASISMLMGVFVSMDLVSFYVFFEAVLIPLILLIQGWGNGENPQSASRKFLLFTLAGSIPMVIGLIALAMAPAVSGQPSTISFMELSKLAAEAPIHGSNWVVWLLLLGFGIKLAILPLHTWLPTTYAAAHPNTTSLIASVVAKLGLYGIIRIVIPLTYHSLITEAQMLIGALGAIAIVYGALVALSKSNLREVLAYSSLSHVGFITLGLMSLNSEGLSGATLQMFNHGLITASMFWILAMLEQRRGPVSLATENQGLAGPYPKLAVLLVFFTLAGAGLPGLNGFVGELLAMSGMIRVSGSLVTIAVLGTVLGAWYALRIVQRVLFGGNGNGGNGNKDHHGHHHGHHQPETSTALDLRPWEWQPLVVVAFLCLYIGVLPQRSMKLFQADTERISKVAEPAVQAAHPNTDQLVSK